jgi:uncharacterized protein YjbJ (UPF0337 family)
MVLLALLYRAGGWRPSRVCCCAWSVQRGIEAMHEETRGPQRDSRSAARDQSEGQMRETKGRVKESWGALTGNERLRAEGRSDQVAGAGRRKKGQWKQRLKAWIDRL